MATLPPQMEVDCRSFVVGTEVVAAVERAAGSCSVGCNFGYNLVGFV